MKGMIANPPDIGNLRYYKAIFTQVNPRKNNDAIIASIQLVTFGGIMKFLYVIALTSLFSTQVFAAKFARVSKLSSLSVQKLAEAGLKIVKNEEVFGDNGSVDTMSFVRKSTETNMASMKQLSFQNGANTDDSQEDFQNATVKKIIDFAFYAVENQEGEYEEVFRAARKNLTDALNVIKADKTLKIYGNQHADEDGSWNMIFVFDTENNQILMVKIGYSGT